MKRQPFYCCLCFILSVTACYYLGFFMALPLAVVLAAGAVLFYRKWRSVLFAGLSAALAVAVCALHMHYLVLPTASLAGQTRDVVITVTGEQHYGRATVGEGVANIIVDGSRFDNVGVRFVWYGEGSAAMLGQSFFARADITALGLKSDTYGRHIPYGRYITLALPAEIEALDGPAHPLSARLAILRQWIADTTERTVGGSAGALLASILTGDSARLPKRARDTLSISGLSHLTAVSGLHVTLAAGVAVFLFGGGKRRGAYIAGAGVAVGYCALAGFAPSSARAAVMFLIFAVSQIRGGKSDALTSLGQAGAFMCALNPFVVGSISFVLSFLATFGIILLSGPIEEAIMTCLPKGQGWAARMKTPVVSASVTMGAMIFTAPVSAALFGRLPVFGVLANMLAVPVMPVALVLAAVSVLCAGISPALGALAALPARIVAGYILGVARLVSSLPLASLAVTERYQIVMLIGVAATVLMLVCMGSGLGSRTVIAAACCAVITVCATFLGHEAVRGQAPYLLCFEENEAVAIIRGGEAMIFNLPGDAYNAGVVADALERLGVDRAALLTGASSQSARMLTRRIPAAFCLMDDGGHPIGAGEAIPVQGGVLTALGLDVMILAPGDVLIDGEKLDAITREYDILSNRLVRLMSPAGTTRVLLNIK